MTYRYSKEAYRLLHQVLDTTGLSNLPQAEVDALAQASQVAFEQVFASNGMPLPKSLNPVEVTKGDDATALHRLNAGIVCGEFVDPHQESFTTALLLAFAVSEDARDRFLMMFNTIAQTYYGILGLEGLISMFTPMVPALLISDGGNA